MNKTLIFGYILPVVLFLVVALLIMTIDRKPLNVEEILQDSPQTSEELRVRVSIPYWEQETAFSSFSQNISNIKDVAFFWYYLTEDGAIEQYEFADINQDQINFAEENNIRTTVVLTNLGDDDGSGWSSERVENVIGDRDSRDDHIDDIVALLNELGVDGISIDYEEVDSDLEDEFSMFIEELGERLEEEEKRLGVALHPKSSESGGGLGEFQNWDKIGKHADEVYLMAYNEHWDQSAAGPVASVGWTEDILQYAVSQIPPEKIFLGVPLYGYDWNKDNEDSATGLTFSDIQTLLSQYGVEVEWDNSHESPYLFYEDEDGNTHEVWFENAESVMEKKNLAEDYDLHGITLWRLGGEDPAIWERL